MTYKRLKGGGGRVAPAGLGPQLKRDPRDCNATQGNKVGAKSTWSIPIERAGVAR